ncbi:putative baseplate assembly protein [Amycolatopsis sp. OK19-0408]|uniref:Baseplate assembly protein n=1 Tax=Amycolatopsis iheyensis TaxID=2945988 RepID=A0A9X2NHB3_9PSEU|nr:putative baseplate assembly protein [Amycolatopsis iheyensis]MCR6487828.1 putative baseplate assembly protein [Amycolatopsis iheyensis]
MPLPTPDLDDRRYADLVRDALRLVRRSCPEWTDHTAADPGVTLVEAFAAMTEQLLSRLNRVPDRLHVKFLDLIGLRLVPPTPARVPLTFWLSSPAKAAVTVPRGTEAGTARTEAAEPVVFTTTETLTLSPCSVTAVRTRESGAAESAGRAASGEFPAFSQPPRAGDELLVGLDRAAPGCAVRLDFTGRTEGLGVAPADPPLAWEAWTGDGWAPCAVGSDTTGGLNRDGAVVVHVPAGHRTDLVDGALAGWLRARVLAAGEGRSYYTASPVVGRLGASTVGGTVDAVHAELVFDEVLGAATGVAGQVFAVRTRPLLAGLGSPVVEVGTDDGWQEWTEVDDFADSGPEDRHFRLDAALGEVSFGPVVRESDGGLRWHGAVPAEGAAVRLSGHATGGGSAGNLPRSAISVLKSSVPFVSAVENREAAHGGTDGETLEEARGRAPLLLRTRARAVTAEDYEALAAQAVPEAARVRCVAAGGVVKVLVVPVAAQESGRIAFADLVPPPALLDRLARKLDEVRLIGTRVSVEPPRYRGVTVVARLTARPRADRRQAHDDALDALYRYLNPLPGGGPDGQGWPFGRSVRTGDVYGVLQAVRGVEFVEDVRLFTADPVLGERGSEQQNVTVEPDSLIFSFDHQVRVEEHGC